MFLLSLASAALIIPLLINSRKSEQINRVGNSSIFGSQINQKQKFSCPKNCFCAHSTVICKGLGLERVPKAIPNDTTKLDLQGNRITKLYFDDFIGLNDLRTLLRDNLIQEIENNVFENLPALERLRLDKNRLRSLPANGLFKFNKLLRRFCPFIKTTNKKILFL
uniref:LRRNT domain-containing protein n=2 Tax=Meloidogyne incognita TaxID=6306 RepID=A0A914MVK7_MELIC